MFPMNWRQRLMVAGSAAIPAFAFLNDSKLGFFRKAASKLGVGVGGTEVLEINATDALFSMTGSIKTPVGTIAQRTGTPSNGLLRYNSELVRFEGYTNGAWGAISGGAYISEFPPAIAQPGDFWWAADIGTLLVYYNDGNSSQWVSATPSFNGSIYLPTTGGTVTGPMTFNAAATFGSTISVAGLATFNTLTATGAATFGSTLNVTGAVGFASTLNVTGTTTLGTVSAGGITASGLTATNVNVTNVLGLAAGRYIDQNGTASLSGVYGTYFNCSGGMDVAGTIGAGNFSTGGSPYFGGTISTGGLSTGGTVSAGYFSTGGTVQCGAMQISSGAPQINMADVNWGTFLIHCNDGNIGFLGTGGGWILRVDNGGNTFATGNVAAYSDARLKKDIVPITGAVDDLAHLQGVRYTRIDSGDRRVGLIAQNVMTVIPEAVLEDKEGMLSIAYGDLVGVLVAAINELNERIKVLESR